MPLERQMDFLIIGAAKCATTWLQMSLMETQEIFMPDPELHYFSREYERGPDWYSSYFEAAGGAQLVGEKSNSYMTAPKAAERIKRDCPGVRLIVQMRDPVQRAYSDYCMLFRRGEVNDDIYAHLDPDRAADQRFLNDGLYAFHLRRFFRSVPGRSRFAAGLRRRPDRCARAAGQGQRPYRICGYAEPSATNTCEG